MVPPSPTTYRGLWLAGRLGARKRGGAGLEGLLVTICHWSGTSGFVASTIPLSLLSSPTRKARKEPTSVVVRNIRRKVLVPTAMLVGSMSSRIQELPKSLVRMTIPWIGLDPPAV